MTYWADGVGDDLDLEVCHFGREECLRRGIWREMEKRREG
jgi:hypothetical protein